MELTTRITNEDGVVTVWIDNDGLPSIEQPFNPLSHEDWSSEEEAQSWADAWIVEYNNKPEPTPLA